MLNTRSAQATPHPYDQPVTDRLALEWRRLTITRQELATVRGWLLPGGEVRSLDDVLARCGYRPAPLPGSRPVSRPRADQRNRPDDEAIDDYMLRLLLLAKTEPLAARIVLQRILPALSALSRRHATGPTRQHAVLDELGANAWPAICAYPVARRTRRVVSNLVRDIGFQTFIRPNRRRQASERPVPTDQLDRMDMAGVEPLAELLEVLQAARQRGVVSDADVEVLCALVSRGRADLVAADRGVTARTVRNHRDAAVHRLRHFVADAA